MLFKKNKQTEQNGYSFKPREYDRDERIELQKIVSGIPVTRKLLKQELLVTATYNYVVKNMKIGQKAATNVNTTKHPQVFLTSLKDLIESTENLVKVEPFWRFEGRGPGEQLEDLTTRKNAIIKGFLNETFSELVETINSKPSPSQRQRLFDEYQQSLINNIDVLGEENFEFFKELCIKKLNVQDNDAENDD